MMSELFSVSTDYLLKDDAKQEVTTSWDNPILRRKS